MHDASKFSHSNGALTIPENTARWPYETYINLLIFELAHYKLDQSNPSERIGWYRPASRSFFKNLAIGAKQGQAGMSPAIGDLQNRWWIQVQKTSQDFILRMITQKFIRASI